MNRVEGPEGQVAVGAGGGATNADMILPVTDTSTLFAKVGLSANDLHEALNSSKDAKRFSRLKVGQVIQVQLPVLKQTVSAKVSTVDRVIDPASGTFRVRLTLPNPRNDIPSGLRCQVNF